MEIDALASGAELAVDGARHSVPPERPVLQNPAEVLAALLDFSGSVALAELLQAPAPNGPPHPQAAELASKLQDAARAQLDALLPRARSRLTSASRPQDPRKLLEAIDRATGVPGRLPDGQAALRLARELGAPLRSALAASLRQAQSDLAALRSNIAEELRALGPRADRLERIDAALQLSIQHKLATLFERLVLAAESTFERACVYACAALPEGFSETEIAEWTCQGGWIDRYRERCERMTQAFCVHLQRSVEGLLLAAVQAEVAT